MEIHGTLSVDQKSFTERKKKQQKQKLTRNRLEFEYYRNHPSNNVLLSTEPTTKYKVNENQANAWRAMRE